MMIGKRLSDRYKILEMIGGGGMANVYLAHDMILDRDVAVKMLRLDFANDEEFIRRFRREAQSATSLAHPNIVNIFDVGEEGDLYYIVMEFIDGQTLKQYIQQNSPLKVEDAIGIMRQLTSAISNAHQNHIIHRDIKPHNILVDHDGNVKITDFGIAMALSATSITQTNSVLGSVHYLSPEQARGGMATKKSDIYSLGIVMFELLTGRLPFSGESAVSIALKHLQSETPSVRRWNPTIPQSVENIVLKATAKDPFHRYKSVDEMEEDLQSALDLERMNEPKFVVPIDNEATKAIPVITDHQPLKNLDETLVHSNEKTVNSQKEASKKNKKKGKNGDKKRKKWPIVLLSTFLVLAILGILAVTMLPGLLAAKDVKIPDISGMSEDAAVSALKSNGLAAGEKIKITDEKVKKGAIIKTSPEIGSTVKENSKVTLYISTGKEKYELSKYVGMQYEDVIRLLEDQDFKEIKKTEITDDSEPGTIISQSPAEGEKVIPEETVLEFEVSKGPEKIILKDLSQYSLKSAQDYASLVGLTVQVTEEKFDETIPSGMVISQSPNPGTELTKGDKVSVVISKGQEPPKKVTRDITIPFEPMVPGEPGQKQEVIIYIEDMNHSMTEPAETFTITENTPKKIELMIAYGKKAGYRVFVDTEVVAEETINYDDVE
ncbi:Stk1 family PASTA domain-containing Ser/Thr kinase [Neobacillus jeddahensis]|uniref:Stk1 family PASTA domain-containing Ser/Thr kinase n=1 Tax=Neobacillus jeddahensis TaxID=1461580 RepID=UPI00058AEF36|nr:Stk1 family PASTA domain-containing Ser/Thr kinase [Neobacillus jeddahensis]